MIEVLINLLPMMLFLKLKQKNFHKNYFGPLAIDGAAMGLETEDELEIARLVQKQSILTITSWNTSDTVDSQIFTWGVNPWQYKLDSTTGANLLRLPPCAWVASMFEHWRGDIVIRLLDFVAV